jgi:hypothetical protein
MLVTPTANADNPLPGQSLSAAESMEEGGLGEEGGLEEIEAVFGGIDWATANFSELEAQWRAQLAAIEKVRVCGGGGECVFLADRAFSCP